MNVRFQFVLWVLKVALLVTSGAALGFLCVLLHDADCLVIAANATISNTGTQAVASLRSAQADVHALSDELVSDSDILRQHADRVLTEAGLTAKEARKESEFFNDHSPEILAKINTDLDELGATTREAGATIRTFGAGLNPFLVSGTKLLNDLDTDVASPGLRLTLENAGKMSSTGVLMMNDAQRWERETLFPPKKRGRWNAIRNTGKFLEWVLETKYYGGW